MTRDSQYHQKVLNNPVVIQESQKNVAQLQSEIKQMDQQIESTKKEINDIEEALKNSRYGEEIKMLRSKITKKKKRIKKPIE